jgi:hypothetical protein
MKYTLKIVLESRYTEKEEIDIKHLMKKIEEFAEFIKMENNKSKKHLGLHFTMSRFKVYRGEK